MIDRYEEALRVLDETPAPDQWDDIQERADAATETEAHVIYLNGKRRRHPRARWAVWTTAAAVVVLALMGAMALANRNTSSVTDTGRADRPERAETTTTTTEPPDTTTEPNNTTGGTESEPEPDEVVPPPPSSPEDGETPSTDPSTTTGEDVATCRALVFRSTNAPPDIAEVQGPATPNDPRVHEAAWPNLIGAFESSETDDRVVHVVASGGFAADGGTRVQVPDLGVEAWVAHSELSGQGLAELTTNINGESCTVTFSSRGLSTDELTPFIRGLGHAH